MVKTAYFLGIKAADVPPPTGFVVPVTQAASSLSKNHTTRTISFNSATRPTGDGPEVVDAYKYYWRNGTDAFEEFSLEEDFQFEQIWTDRIVTGVS